MNPYPYDMRTAKTHTTIKSIVDNHDRALEALLKARADEFSERFILMSFNEQPRAIRRISKVISCSVDQTFVESPNRKAYSRANLDSRAAEEAEIDNQSLIKPGATDVTAGFYVSSGGIRGDVLPSKGERFDAHAANKKAKLTPKYQIGYAGNIAIRVDGERPGSNRFPNLIVAATMSIPNEGVSEEAVSLLRSVAKTGLTPGFAAADKEYFANAVFERLHDPIVAMGFTPSTDYRKDRTYISDATGGALYVNDAVVCPATQSRSKWRPMITSMESSTLPRSTPGGKRSRPTI